MPKAYRGACSGKTLIWYLTANGVTVDSINDITTVYIDWKYRHISPGQNRLGKCGRDLVCSQNSVSSLTQTKFYKSQSQYFPTDNFPPLESEASLLDLSNKGKCSIPVRHLEVWKKTYSDQFARGPIVCMQQQTMSVQALSRLLEAIAKSIKHATAMSTILATEIFQARRDAVLATSKKR